MAHDIELGPADGFKFPAYEARPAGPIKGAVVVVQEIFGVNSHIRGIVDAFAVQGYLAVAPAMFHRVKPGVDLGYSGEDVAAGVALKAAVDALPAPGAMQDLQAAVDYAAQFGKVGVIGFCWGGLLTWRAACQLRGVSAAIAYYGGGMTQPAEIARHPQCPVMAHFGDQDHAIPMPGVQAFQAAHPEVAVHIYSAEHGFNCNQRGSFDEAAATLARGRSLAFFASHLQSAPAPSTQSL